MTPYIDKAVKCIENDDLEGIEKLLLKDKSLGSMPVYTNFNPRNIFQCATKEGRDDIAYLLFISDPNMMSTTLCQNTIRDITLTSDILGDAVVNKRYQLVEKLLSIEGVYEFNINGFKNTGNILNNCYLATAYDNTSNNFFVGESKTYVSSPFMFSILMGDEKMYGLLQMYSPYFDIENKNCKFHYDNCPKAKIQDDMMMYYNIL
jgi:hypothetical protein